MPGPVPKPDGQRRRRNATPAALKLPAEGRTGPVPTWPLLGRAPRLWAELWHLPEAAAWGKAEVRVVARYVKTSMAVEAMLSAVIKTGSQPPGLSSMQAEIRQIEDRLGMSPMAKLRLRWEVVGDELEERRGEQPAAPEAASPAPAKRRLRVAGGDAVAGA